MNNLRRRHIVGGGAAPQPSSYRGLKFTSIGDTTVALTNYSGNAPDMKYSLDGGSTWIQWNYAAVSLSDGDVICFKGNNPNGFSNISKYSFFVFGGTGYIEAAGDVTSLLDNGACETLSIPCSYCFVNMFQSNPSLTTAPELPATTLATYCYNSMFYNCTSLTTAPELPATTLIEGCYGSMFSGCTSLTTAPELPATTLATYCYNSMFYKCTSLTTAPELPATTLIEGCYSSMFSGCTSLTTAPELPVTTLAAFCYSGMFRNCTSLTTAPELPATTLATYCYQNMFRGCSNLNYIKCLATNISASSNLKNWVSGVSSSGRFVKAASMTSWPSGASGIPSGWTVQNA